MPRFRAEVGPFVGFAAAADLRGHRRRLPAVGHVEAAAIAGGELAVRAGFGLDGADQRIGRRAGVRPARLARRFALDERPGAVPLRPLDAAGGVAAVRSRIGISTRVRMPFYLLPGDLLLLSPMYFVSPETYTGMAVTAGNGGLIPWQAGWATGIGRFQFVLGRELGATFYGYGFENTTVAPPATAGGEPRVVDFRSIHFDLPILEYRPYRAFDTKQSSAVLIQLYRRRRDPEEHEGDLAAGRSRGEARERSIRSALRLIFDWRRYF